MRGEDQSVRQQHDVIGDLARGGEILLEQCRRHRERFAGIVESRLVGRIHGEIARGSDINAGQIAYRVVVFGVTQTPGEHGAGIAGVFQRLMATCTFNPTDDPLAECLVREFLRILRWHIVVAESFQDQLPVPDVAGDRLQRPIRTQVEFCFGLGSTVTACAIGLQERFDDRPEFALQNVSLVASDRAWCDQSAAEKENNEDSASDRAIPLLLTTAGSHRLRFNRSIR